MLRKGQFRAFSQGVDLRGPLALSVTQREGAAKHPRRPRPAFGPTDHESRPSSSHATAPEIAPSQIQVSDEAIMDRALSLLALLRDAPEVRAPATVPCEGKVVSFDNALQFVARYCQFLRDLGPELASPRITFHWTAEENFLSIVESNLRAPSDDTGVKKKHGSAFGRGIYTCPDFKMAKEDFSYGTSATFACLALTGRQLTRHHGKGHGLSECHGADFDSVTGRLPNRYCDTWVLPESDQILPCFLVDEVAIPATMAKLREAISLLREPFPEDESPIACASAEEASAGQGQGEPLQEIAPATATCSVEQEGRDGAAGRWRRRGRAAETAQTDATEKQQETKSPQDLPYGGDLQAAMRAQDRPAIQALMRARDEALEQKKVQELRVQTVADEGTSSSSGGRRWAGKSKPSDSASHSVLAVKAQEPKMHLESVGGQLIEMTGDLLLAKEDFLVHQCNCVFSGGAQGIAEAIFKTFPAADVYKERYTRNRPHDIPGTVSVHQRIVNIYGQLLPGRPADDAPTGGWPGATRFVSFAEAATDTRSARFRWFEACLAALARALPGDGAHSIAFPARIGCGLAGGKWPQYLAALRHFAKQHPAWRVVVYEMDPQQAASSFQPSPDDASQDHQPIDNSSGWHKAKHGAAAQCAGFWTRATFEAKKSGNWIAYSEAEQVVLRSVIQGHDDCDEAIVEAERCATLEALAEQGVAPRSFGIASQPGSAEAGPTAVGLRAKLREGADTVEVSLAQIVSSAGMGEERLLNDSQHTIAAPVRLRLPPVQDGECRLPADLDESLSAPAPRNCGRLVVSAAELTALAQANGHCGICLEEFDTKACKADSGAVIQLRCGHPFHESCLIRWFGEKRRCPTCKRRYGHIVGNQPSIGTMSWRLETKTRLAGYPDAFTIALQFRFPPGKDSAGQQYRGRNQPAFLPHDESGKLLLELFRLAFRRRVLFDLRSSTSDGKYWPAFNIHLKTATSGGAERFGFPDEGYFQRAMQELRDNGITVADLS